MNNTYELYHYGIPGMKWGVRKDPKKQYRSTGIRSAIARRQNEKVDKGFKDWKDNTQKRDNAIEIGKRMTAAKRAYDNDRSNKTAKAEYKALNKEYKKALNSNTTYRKGVVRREVGKDAARKYLSEAKQVKKQLDADPTNKALKKKYNELMSKHDIERANARRATEVSTKRSRKIASIKRTMTITVTTAATAAAVGVGAAAVNKYVLKSNNKINADKVIELAKKAKDAFGYIY